MSPGESAGVEVMGMSKKVESSMKKNSRAIGKENQYWTVNNWPRNNQSDNCSFVKVVDVVNHLESHWIRSGFILQIPMTELNCGILRGYQIMLFLSSAF